jgi:hypothetical protein
MPDRHTDKGPKPNSNSAPLTDQVKSNSNSSDDITEQQMEEILVRARQAVKPIINREAASEVVSEEVLSFKMKSN